MMIPPEIGDYYLTAEIARGKVSSTWKGCHKIMQRNVAVKIMSKQYFNGKRAFGLSQELDILEKIDSESIIQLYQFLEDEDYYYFVMEFATHGNLARRIKRKGVMSERRSQIFLVQIVEAIEYLHKTLGMIHGNLKPENVLVNGRSDIKIMDFGYRVDNTPSIYIAPELQMENPLTPAADIWSIGVLLYFVYTGFEPFEGDFNNQLRFPHDITEQFQDLLTKMLTKNNVMRITLDAIKNHPWYLQGKDLMDGIRVNDEIDMMRSVPSNHFEIKPKTLIHQKAIDEVMKYGLCTEDKLIEDIKNNANNRNTAMYRIASATSQSGRSDSDIISAPSIRRKRSSVDDSIFSNKSTQPLESTKKSISPSHSSLHWVSLTPKRQFSRASYKLMDTRKVLFA